MVGHSHIEKIFIKVVFINNVKTLSDNTLRSGSKYYYAPVVEDANGKRSYNKANKKKISGNTNSADDLVNWIKSS